MNNERTALFEKELNYFLLPTMRDFAEECLTKVHHTFFTVAASKSGRHHHPQNCCAGGLVGHTKQAIHVANMLLNLEQNNHLDRESILFALLFHDCQKYLIDINGKLHFQQNHPLQAATFINECFEKTSIKIPFAVVERVKNLIRSHMGQWNSTQDNIEMPKPISANEQFVHLCDYLASQKTITISTGD